MPKIPNYAPPKPVKPKAVTSLSHTPFVLDFGQVALVLNLVETKVPGETAHKFQFDTEPLAALLEYGDLDAELLTLGRKRIGDWAPLAGDIHVAVVPPKMGVEGAEFIARYRGQLAADAQREHQLGNSTKLSPVRQLVTLRGEPARTAVLLIATGYRAALVSGGSQ